MGKIARLKRDGVKVAPKAIPHYDEKRLYLIQHQVGICPILKANGKPALLNRATKVDLDHSCIHNTADNRAKYPLFIHSLLNLRAVDHDAHLSLPRSQKRMSDYKAQWVETFLFKHRKIAKWLNDPLSSRLFH